MTDTKAIPFREQFAYCRRNNWCRSQGDLKPMLCGIFGGECIATKCKERRFNGELIQPNHTILDDRVRLQVQRGIDNVDPEDAGRDSHVERSCAESGSCLSEKVHKEDDQEDHIKEVM